MGTAAGGRRPARNLPSDPRRQRPVWENMYSKYVEISRAVNILHPSTSRKAKTWWKILDSKANGEEYYDQGSGQCGNRCGKNANKAGVRSRRGPEEDRGKRRAGRLLDRTRLSQKNLVCAVRRAVFCFTCTCKFGCVSIVLAVWSVFVAALRFLFSNIN